MVNEFQGFRNSDSLSNANTFCKTVLKNHKIDIRTKTRIAPVVKYRRFFYKFMQEVCKEPLFTMGSFLGQDHATALHAIKTADALFATEIQEKTEYETIKATVIGTALPKYIPDKKDKFIADLTEKLQHNHDLLSRYQKKLSDLEDDKRRSNIKLINLQEANMELRKEIKFLKREMRHVYQEYKKEKGIRI